MPKLSRRSLVTSAAALPALAVPALAATTDLSGNLDAELVRMGQELLRLQSAYEASIVELNEKGDPAAALARERIGPPDPAGSTKERSDLFAAELEKAYKEAGADVTEDNCDILCGQTGRLAEKIMAIPAYTVAGLRAKTIAAVQCCEHSFWNRPFDDLDWEEKGARSLIEAACLLTGVNVPVEAVQS
jgi:hypothetical protein